MSKSTKSSRSTNGTFTLGRERFSKISAVEGIRLSHQTAKTFEEFDRKKLSPQERREALNGKFAPKR